MLKTTLILAVMIGSATIAAGCDAMPWADDDAESAAAVATDEAPADLASTGLYASFATKAIAPSARSFTPAVAFWSDGFEKDRWIQLPDGKTIDAANQDDWKFPVGTKTWKEIRKGGRKIETRYFWKVAEGQWLSAAYVWSPDGQRATRGENTDVDVDGTKYHVPSSTECATCHKGRKDKVLGFEAISLGQLGAQGLNLGVLVNEKRILPAPARTTVTVPEPALAILHVNCGITCHNGNTGAEAYGTKLRMRLGFDEVTKPVAEWEAFKTSVGVDVTSPEREGVRIKPGSPDGSALMLAMKTRGEGQMPPIATKVADAKSVEAVAAWIKGLH